MKIYCSLILFFFCGFLHADEKFEVYTTVEKGKVHTNRIIAFSKRRGIFYYWVFKDVSSFSDDGYECRGDFSQKNNVLKLFTDFGVLVFTESEGVLTLTKAGSSEENIINGGWVLEKRNNKKLIDFGLNVSLHDKDR